MIVFALLGAVIVGFAGGLLVNMRQTAKQAIATHLRQLGLTKDAAKRYRDAAKILHDLTYVSDLEQLVPVLPAPMRKRVETWLAEHRKSVEEGK